MHRALAALSLTLVVGCRPEQQSAPPGEAAANGVARSDDTPAPAAAEALRSVDELAEACRTRLMNAAGLTPAALAELEGGTDEQRRVLQTMLAQLEPTCRSMAERERGRLECEREMDATEYEAACRYVPVHRLAPEDRPAVAALARLTQAMQAFYDAPHPHEDWEVEHGCGEAGSWDGDTDFVPPLGTACARGADGRCVAVERAEQPWEYDASIWDRHAVWSNLSFAPQGDEQRFHYRVSWKNEFSSDGCFFQVQAATDAVDGGEPRTYSFEFAIDHNGMNLMEVLTPDSTP